MLQSDFLPPTSIIHPAPSRRSSLSLFNLSLVFALTASLGASLPAVAQQPGPAILDAMTTELHRAFTSLGKPDVAPSLASATADAKDEKGSPAATAASQQIAPYFLSYTVSDASYVSVRAEYGALAESSANRIRVADVQVRVGAPALDNTHGTHRASAVNSMQLPLGDDREALARSLWLATNTGYGNALDSYLRVKTEAEVRAKEEDTSPDFSQEAPQTHIGEVAPPIVVDRAAWEQRARELSRVFREFPDVYQNMVQLTVQNETDYFASSEGSRIVTPHLLARVVIVAATRADDGMDLFRDQTFEAETADALPKQADLEAAARDLGRSLEALSKAPITEPFDGPAILSGRAAAVFFHEVLGHRIEGQRQKNEDEAQTFKKKINQAVLPDFLSVYSDPTLKTFANTDLVGYYPYDDEGVKARRVTIVDKGILRTFLMSRAPIESFDHSNGHGRRQQGYKVVARQSNLVVESSKQVSRAELKKELIEQVKATNKPYGLLFDDIEGGFTFTQRVLPNAFNVRPTVVYRVYPDGKEELVRGVDLIGTPLIAFSKIIAADDQIAVFNGVCGAESGWVPVSASSPGLFVSQIEVQRKEKSQERVPILPPPPAFQSK